MLNIFRHSFNIGSISIGSAAKALAVATVFATSIGAAHAVPVRVDWTASVTPVSPGSTSPGDGVITGTFGVFDVIAVGDSFILPGDGSLGATASGFVGGFPNGDYVFTRETASPLILEFLSVGLTAAEFSAAFVDNNAGILSPTSNPCTIDGVSDDCFISLFDTAGTGVDIVVASIALDGTLDDSSLGEIQFSFTLLPVEIPIPAAFWLFGSALAGLIAVRRRKKIH